MAIAWIELETPMDPSSRIKRTPRMITHAFGDGYQYRQKDGINNMPRQFTVQYKNVSPDENIALGEFLAEHGSTGVALEVPLLPENYSGPTALFYIVDFDGGADDGGMLFNWTIQLQEVFGE